MVFMTFYQLQARLKNGGVINLNFEDLNSSLNQLVEIDQFTNPYNSWDFLELASTHVEHEIPSMIESIQIAVKGKEFCYSACFKNPYLDAIFNEVSFTSIRHNQIPINSNAFIEMVEFLFSDLEQKGDNFLNNYPYKNRFAVKVYRYLNIHPLSEEDLREQRILKQEIIHEMSEYKVYRSLCIYRKSLDRKKNQIPVEKKRVEIEKPLETIPTVFRKVIYEDEEDGLVTQYASNWENSNGEEREEFLSEEEVREMVKTYE